MAILPETFFSTYENNGKRYGMALEEYNGKFSLVSCEEGNNGTLYARWCFPQLGKEKKPADKAVPMKLSMGDDKPAVSEWLQTIAGILSGNIGDDEPSF